MNGLVEVKPHRGYWKSSTADARWALPLEGIPKLLGNRVTRLHLLASLHIRIAHSLNHPESPDRGAGDGPPAEQAGAKFGNIQTHLRLRIVGNTA
jgi:hypothetical protein